LQPPSTAKAEEDSTKKTAHVRTDRGSHVVWSLKATVVQSAQGVEPLGAMGRQTKHSRSFIQLSESPIMAQQAGAKSKARQRGFDFLGQSGKNPDFG
jgi:hypothetical protein